MTINVGTGEDVSIRELAEMVARCRGLRGHPRLGHLEARRNTAQAARRVPHQSLGWRPTIGLREGVQSTYGWYLSMTDGVVARQASTPHATIGDR